MSNLFFDAGPPATGQKVCLATIVYDSPSAAYTYAIAQSREALTEEGIQSAYMLLAGNCHVDDSRNNIAREFIASDCTDLVFLDADVTWEPEHLVRLCRYDRDFIGGVYPYRREGEQETMPVRPLYDRALEADGALEVDGIPTGFMRLRRVVLEALVSHAKFYKHKGRSTALLFERTIDDNGERWGGDYSFCKKWQACGGRIYVDPELRLGHVTKTILYDSVGAHVRRQNETTLEYVAKQIRAGTADLASLCHELFKYADNRWAANPSTLALTVLVARKARNPIIEAGSGLTTVLMAAANPDVSVYALEHDPDYWRITRDMIWKAGVTNAYVSLAPLKDNWYDLHGIELPEHFAVGLCDGPPRQYGSRMRFYEEFGERCSAIIADDADDPHYAEQVEAWAKEHGRETSMHGRAMLVLKPGLMNSAMKEAK